MPGISAYKYGQILRRDSLHHTPTCAYYTMNGLFLLLLAVPAALGQALQNATIHPGADIDKCLEVRGGVVTNGTVVQM